ncbi:hypothetical protein C8J56DRAFT_903348 [Mycena floridula]|nr:hypothetical protein C8J56DRAFT_903348 [Mycena floridula]
MFDYECMGASSQRSREIGLVTDQLTRDISAVPVLVATQKDGGPCCQVFADDHTLSLNPGLSGADVTREPIPETSFYRNLRRSIRSHISPIHDPRQLVLGHEHGKEKRRCRART